MIPKPTRRVIRNVGFLVLVCTFSALAGRGVAYYRFRSKSAVVQRAELERQKAVAPTRSMFAEGDRIPLPKECVYGHSALKDVDILWGHPWDFGDVKEKFERHEVVLAGTDAIGPNAKSRTVYCPTCDFILELGYGPWTRTAENPASFVQPFSVLVRTFLSDENVARLSERYTQDVIDRNVIGERLEIVTNEPLANVKMHVIEWARRHGLRLKPETLPEMQAHRLYPSGPPIVEQSQIWDMQTASFVTGMVQFASFPEDRIVRVSLLTGLKRGEKMSIDEALLSNP